MRFGGCGLELPGYKFLADHDISLSAGTCHRIPRTLELIL